MENESITYSERFVAAHVTTHPAAIADLFSARVSRDDVGEYFDDATAATVMDVAFDLFDRGVFTSHDVLKTALKDRNVFDVLGGDRWWREWVTMGWSDDDVPYHLERVVTARDVREKSGIIRDAMADVETSGVPLFERHDRLVDHTARLVQSHARRADTLFRLDDLANVLRNGVDDDMDFHLPTGWHAFDSRFSGIPVGRLTVVASRPGHGKTLFSEWIAMNCIRQWYHRGEEKQVLYFDAENNPFEKSVRMATILANMNAGPGDLKLDASAVERYMQGERPDAGSFDAERIDRALELMDRYAPFFTVDHHSAPTVDYTTARTLAEDHRRPVGLVVYDYVELTGEPGPDRSERVTRMTEGLHALARDMRRPVIAGSQLNRGADDRDEPLVRDLAWSDALNKLARMVLMPYHPFTQWETSASEDLAPNRWLYNIFVRKNKGPLGTVDLRITPSGLSLVDPSDPVHDR